MKELFLLRRAGREPLVYLHPALEPILSESLGTFVYQEQVMKAAVALAGFTPAEADELRRAMTKGARPSRWRPPRALPRGRAPPGACARPWRAALFESLAKFSGYGFCKAHAATYGEFSYQAAYLKAHFPAEFMAAVLVNEAGFYHHSVYIEEAKRLGVRVALPDVNRSEPDYQRKDGTLYFGLWPRRRACLTAPSTHNGGPHEFPFTSLSDFLSRVETHRGGGRHPHKVRRLRLVREHPPRAPLEARYDVPAGPPGMPDCGQVSNLAFRRCVARRGPGTRPGARPLLPLAIPKVCPPVPLPRLPDYALAQKLRMELEYLEASVTCAPARDTGARRARARERRQRPSSTGTWARR